MQSSKTRRGKGQSVYALRLAAWSLVGSKSYLGIYVRNEHGWAAAASRDASAEVVVGVDNIHRGVPAIPGP